MNNPREASETQNPINLAPGIDLVVQPSHENEDMTRDCIERCKAAIVRADHIAAVKRGLARFLELHAEERTWSDGGDVRDVAWYLEVILQHGPMWIPNGQDVSAEMMAKVITALCTVLDDEVVAETRGQIDFFLAQLESAS